MPSPRSEGGFPQPPAESGSTESASGAGASTLESLSAEPPPASRPASVAQPNKWEIYVGLSGGIRPESLGAGIIGVLGFTRSLTPWLRLDGMVGTGVYSRPTDHLIPFRIGVRVEWPSQFRVRPFLYLAFAHQHEAPLESLLHDPLPVIASFSEHVHHRTGVDTGLGLSIELPRSKSSLLAGRLMFRGAVAHLFGGGAPRYVDFTAGVGACF